MIFFLLMTQTESKDFLKLQQTIINSPAICFVSQDRLIK